MNAVTPIVIGALLLPLGACVTNPQYAAGSVNQQDVKFKTAGCSAARQQASDYNAHGVERAGAGFALGLLLGPFGLPVAAALDATQEGARRKTMSALNDSCVTIFPRTLPPPSRADVTVSLSIQSEPAGGIAVVGEQPLSQTIRTQAEANRIAGLSESDPFWKTVKMIAHCQTPCVAKIPRGKPFYVNVIKSRYASLAPSVALTWVNDPAYGSTLNSDAVSFRLVPVVPQ